MKRSLAATAAILAFGAAAAAPSASAVPIRFFHTADGTIGCAIIKPTKKHGHHKHFVPRISGVARCDVRGHTWVAPPQPRSCDLDWGDGVEVGDRTPATYVCAGDSVADARSVAVGAGNTVALGPFSCSVLTSTVRCANVLTGSGFEVGVATVSLF